MPKAISRLQRLLGWLLCALVLSAALDNIPDPPVIRPHQNQAAGVCLTSPHQPAERDWDLDSVLLNPLSSLRRVERNWHFESRPLQPLAPLFPQASDSSPPLQAS